VKLRDATVDDAARLDEIWIAAWRAAYPGKCEPSVLRDVAPFGAEEWRRRIDAAGDVIVAIDEDGVIAGYVHTATPTRDADEPDGVAEIVALNVHPDCFRRGVGRELLAAALERIRAAGWRVCSVWTLDDNHRSLPLYGSFGFRRDGARRTDDGWLVPDVRLRVGLINVGH